jgi:hypothetical protein
MALSLFFVVLFILLLLYPISGFMALPLFLKVLFVLLFLCYVAGTSQDGNNLKRIVIGAGRGSNIRLRQRLRLTRSEPPTLVQYPVAERCRSLPLLSLPLLSLTNVPYSWSYPASRPHT